jgi:SAM-dependent methyltransferase
MIEHEPKDFLHSDGCLTDSRDQWWNDDFLKIMADRWRLSEVDTVLDVGCGLAHWSCALLGYLPPHARILGVDKHNEWVQKATQKMQAMGLADRFTIKQSYVENLPVKSESFDLVTCQTLLMHVSDPRIAIQEMIRAVKPGGLVAVAEPNNLANVLISLCSHPQPSPDVIARLVEFHLRCGRGKAALGKGDSFIGEQVPGLFAEAGLCDIQVFGSDKCRYLIPPYTTRIEQKEIDCIKDYINKEFVSVTGDKSHTFRCFVEGGGDREGFEELWQLAYQRQFQLLTDIQECKHHSAGSFVHYLVSGRKKQ